MTCPAICMGRASGWTWWSKSDRAVLQHRADTTYGAAAPLGQTPVWVLTSTDPIRPLALLNNDRSSGG